MTSSISNVTVIGAGTMGNGIAHVFAMKDYSVVLCDISEAALEKALATISKNLDRMVAKEKITEDQKTQTIRGYSTSDVTMDMIMESSKDLGKIPTEVNDYPGFVANRILMPMINEAIISLHEGVAGVSEIDTVMKLGMAHPMGPLQLADFIGLDVCLSIMNVLYDGFGNPKYAPCPLLVNMVMAGMLGRKSGEGFYKYEKGSKELVVSESFR